MKTELTPSSLGLKPRRMAKRGSVSKVDFFVGGNDLP